jgi:transposase
MDQCRNCWTHSPFSSTVALVRATSAFPDTASTKAAIDAPPAPFSQVFVTITQQEHIELRLAAKQWQGLHRKAVTRFDQQEVRHDRIVREIKAQALKSNAALQVELDSALAQVRDLQKRLFSTKSERNKPSESRPRAAACRKRGQQASSAGHGRTIEAKLPERHEDVVLQKAQCPECGLAFKEFAGTEDAQVLEIEVKAYRRVIHRHRYMPTCQCGCVGGIVTAPSPARLINRGKFGISVWTSVLLDKFAYGRPSQRLLQDLADHGLNMAPGVLWLVGCRQ